MAYTFLGLTFGSTATGALPSSSSRADVVPGASDRAVTTGVNWYPNRWLKVQLNGIRETITDARSRGPSSTFWSRVLRVQVTI